MCGEPGALVTAAKPSIGIGYRHALDAWTHKNLDRFDTLEVIVDHCIYGSPARRDGIFDLASEIPVVAHGIGLSIGTDVPLDLSYLNEVARTIERLGAGSYSEHLAFTRVPGRELMNLMPLPRTTAAAEGIVAKVRAIQAAIPVPFLLENIAYIFEWPVPEMDEASFLNLVLAESGAGLLLDIENVRLNARNHGFDAAGFIDRLPPGTVQQVHLAGGAAIEERFLNAPFLADSHSHPVSDEALDLLECVLARHRPTHIILERDTRLSETEEILADIVAIRSRIASLKDIAVRDIAL